ncbi:bifunctional proline dehydrogenase/L-glutamate gamma-semialdehyde dehydrogenase PutA [Cohaesibacter intestini]|uniref:bifunctional proline dehydrogenase/L-glutamate gamma-semialdehyde dehydrogenase PutA n=1 Tax=Cohaesibacter intestini TaxID=2211145 RepID=UPI000DEA213D|nr:bifunctional proline dehydrogenase/L-glutamate gamma-semialdehyde dehydrogenase PutA [Cohaesibacter intestini]
MDQQNSERAQDLTDRMTSLRTIIRDHYLADEAQNVRRLMQEADLDEYLCARASKRAADLVRTIRTSTAPTMMESFLAQYGLSTKEGIALMCLAEALLRVPDPDTIDALISDKIAPSEWGVHLGKSASSLVNASTWGLMLTGKLLKTDEEKGLATTLHSMVKRMGEPVVRTAVAQAMKELGRQFVLGTTIEKATNRAEGMQKKGYVYSYDMLGESARTEADAMRYHIAYSDAITALAKHCKSDDTMKNPGISVKLSALHSRYEMGKKDRVLKELTSRTLSLALLAKSANMGFNIDAEEMDRLDLSLDVIEKVFSDPALAGWDGFGVVVQSYGHRASFVVDWLYALTHKLDRKITVRLVKGAYWDAEVKRAQVMGLESFPVFTRKVNSDVSYLSNARRLLDMTDRIYPQFASHNAHSVAAILEIAQTMGIRKDRFEFQRLHGMGESLFETLMKTEYVNCRIYAPVGAHEDLLAYLVRRLLENGANSSFVNQIVDESIAPEEIAKDPFAQVRSLGDAIANPYITKPKDIFGAKRVNSQGWDHTDPVTMAKLDAERGRFKTHQWSAKPMVDGYETASEMKPVFNPADPSDQIGLVAQASSDDVEAALAASLKGFEDWSQVPTAERAAILRKVGDLYEAHAPEFFALASREAGKTMLDAIGEVREAVDFARFYANEAERLEAEAKKQARGTIACISPWNFPLAIFTGQILAALAAGNAVLAKPAGPTPLIAARAVELMHEAGVPKAAMQLLPGSGRTVGTPITSDPRIAGVCFTGSTGVAQTINRAMAEHVSPDAPVIAETGGLNAMIVDSTALPEQAVRDILASSFQSAGQRCSALRMLYVQEDIYERVIEMLKGAMAELALGNPWDWATDIGPVIDQAAKGKIDAHCEKMRAAGKLIKQLNVPESGIFCAPTIIQLSGIEELEEEIFGPVLHVASFAARNVHKVVETINAKGFGLTFGLHTRMDNRVQDIVDRIKVGNIYVNRNQIGAIVGSQPFGGEGLSGTGPKAGGPHYVNRFYQGAAPATGTMSGEQIATVELQYAIHELQTEHELRTHWAANAFRYAALKGVCDMPVEFDAHMGESLEPQEMPGPTGESNRLTFAPRGIALVIGGDDTETLKMTVAALVGGCAVVLVAPGAKALAEQLKPSGAPIVGFDGHVDVETMSHLDSIDAIACCFEADIKRALRIEIAKRDGVLMPLIVEADPARFILERHLCIDTTASGGNAQLLAAAEGRVK